MSRRRGPRGPGTGGDGAQADGGGERKGAVGNAALPVPDASGFGGTAAPTAVQGGQVTPGAPGSGKRRARVRRRGGASGADEASTATPPPTASPPAPAAQRVPTESVAPDLSAGLATPPLPIERSASGRRHRREKHAHSSGHAPAAAGGRGARQAGGASSASPAPSLGDGGGSTGGRSSRGSAKGGAAGGGKRKLAKKANRMLTAERDERNTITFDYGAWEALQETKGGSLLAAAVCEVTGHFAKGDIVGVWAAMPEGRHDCEFGVGKVNFSAADVRRLAKSGVKTAHYAAVLRTDPKKTPKSVITNKYLGLFGDHTRLRTRKRKRPAIKMAVAAKAERDAEEAAAVAARTAAAPLLLKPTSGDSGDEGSGGPAGGSEAPGPLFPSKGGGGDVVKDQATPTKKVRPRGRRRPLTKVFQVGSSLHDRWSLSSIEFVPDDEGGEDAEPAMCYASVRDRIIEEIPVTGRPAEFHFIVDDTPIWETQEANRWVEMSARTVTIREGKARLIRGGSVSAAAGSSASDDVDFDNPGSSSGRRHRVAFEAAGDAAAAVPPKPDADAIGAMKQVSTSTGASSLSRMSGFDSVGDDGMPKGGAPALAPTTSDDGAPHLAVFFSCPYVYKHGGTGESRPMARLDYADEFEKLMQTFTAARRRLRVSVDFASVQKLSSQLTLGCCVLHYSGHGSREGLSFEHEGECNIVTPAWLRQLFANKTPDVVVCSACDSLDAGRAFVEAGVPHVICVERGQEVYDVTSSKFAQQLYLSLARGKSVRKAFQDAKDAIRAEAIGGGGGAAQADKFVLLPEADLLDMGANPSGEEERDPHDRVRPFADLEPMRDWRKQLAPKPLDASNLPRQPTLYCGRAVDTHNVIKLIYEGLPLVTVFGEPPGLGKSALALAVAHHFSVRESGETGKFTQGVLFVQASRVRTLEDLAELLWNALKKVVPKHPITELEEWQEYFRPEMLPYSRAVSGGFMSRHYSDPHLSAAGGAGGAAEAPFESTSGSRTPPPQSSPGLRPRGLPRAKSTPNLMVSPSLDGAPGSETIPPPSFSLGEPATAAVTMSPTARYGGTSGRATGADFRIGGPPSTEHGGDAASAGGGSSVSGGGGGGGESVGGAGERGTPARSLTDAADQLPPRPLSVGSRPRSHGSFAPGGGDSSSPFDFLVHVLGGSSTRLLLVLDEIEVVAGLESAGRGDDAAARGFRHERFASFLGDLLTATRVNVLLTSSKPVLGSEPGAVPSPPQPVGRSSSGSTPPAFAEVATPVAASREHLLRQRSYQKLRGVMEYAYELQPLPPREAARLFIMRVHPRQINPVEVAPPGERPLAPSDRDGLVEQLARHPLITEVLGGVPQNINRAADVWKKSKDTLESLRARMEHVLRPTAYLPG